MKDNSSHLSQQFLKIVKIFIRERYKSSMLKSLWPMIKVAKAISIKIIHNRSKLRPFIIWAEIKTMVIPEAEREDPDPIVHWPGSRCIKSALLMILENHSKNRLAMVVKV